MREGSGRSAVVIGASAGGVAVLRRILIGLRADFRFPIVIALHVADISDGRWPALLGRDCSIEVSEAEEKQPLEGGYAYFAPANYHLLIERDFTFSLTIDERVHFARPSIDVLFETAAEAYGCGLVGILLTGANHDGAAGLRRIARLGGRTVVQDPASAEAPTMPRAGLAFAQRVLDPDGIRDYLLDLNSFGRTKA